MVDLIVGLLHRMKAFFTSRLFVIGVAAVLLFSVLVSRLFSLQIIEGENYQATYLQTSTKTVQLEYTRGSIYDCNGKLLAYNKLTYNVEIVDDGSYNAYNRNLMIVKLIGILQDHNEEIESHLYIDYVDGAYQFTTSSERTLSRFLQDVGVYSTSTENVPEKMRHELSWYTPEYVVSELTDRYGVGITIVNGRREKTYELDPETALKLVDIRYGLALNSGQKYIPQTVSVDVGVDTVSDIMEHEYDLKGVSIATDSERIYKHAVEYAHIIGYTGQVSAEDLSNLDDSYSAGDIVGKTGIESAYESVLKGTKGSRQLVVNNQGIVLSVEGEQAAQAGQDVYLTIDSRLQVGIYHLLEQHLAGVLVSKLVNRDYDPSTASASSEILIPVKDAYYQLVSNNILSTSHFASEEASSNEKRIYKKYVSEKKSLIKKLCNILLDENSKLNDQYDDNISSSLNYIVTLLTRNGIINSSEVDTSSSIYKNWINDKISLRTYLLSAMTQGWIDITALNLSDKYADTEAVMEAIVDIIRNLLEEDPDFDKKIYEYLIQDDQISGCQLCMALFDQGVLKKDKDAYERLKSGSSQAAFSFIVQKIRDLEITPAQLALDPCSGSVVVTDTKTGAVKALVSYPSYDNNRVTSDSSYMAALSVDQSSPLFARATMTKTAPGSIFKPISAMAGMAEKVISAEELITAAPNGTFEKAGYTLRCWYAPYSHGAINVSQALEKSCNYFFSEVAYRLALDSKGNYNEAKGISKIAEYAEKFGLGQNSGVEINEASPSVTDSSAVPSAIGQGTNSYTNTQINRYVTALATKGKVYDLNIVQKITDSRGNVTEEFKAEVLDRLKFNGTMWNAVYKGMHNAVYSNQNYSAWFAGLDYEVAGKTGTAQEDKNRGNHANFICFAPYNAPEVAVSVSMPYGYTAANSVSVASDVLKFYSGKMSLKKILQQSANTVQGSDITD